MDRIDLHTHSNCSDGSLSPRELVQLAKKRELRAIALTDHDTVAGVAEAVAAGKELGVEVVPGVEISAQYPPGTMHILGYCFSPSQPELLKALKKLQKARAARNPKIIERLQALGLEITTDEVLNLSSGQVGRPHIAKALVNRGYVSSIDEAFSRYLKKGAVAYAEKFRFSPREAIGLIRGAGGLAVLAHPSTLGINKGCSLSGYCQKVRTCVHRRFGFSWQPERPLLSGERNPRTRPRLWTPAEPKREITGKGEVNGNVRNGYPSAVNLSLP
jgi:predicted metal-dependent phosphoesterase TrpH